MRLLLVEDDEILACKLVAALTTQHYAVDLASDGEAGWDYSQAASYDLIVLDVGLPKLDGLSLCRKLRHHHYRGPILLLTAKGLDADKVQGLDSGADDYVVKPCTTEELCARIRALLRRAGQSEQSILAWGDLQLDPSVCEVTYQGKLLSLSPKGYALLELFLRNPQRVFSSSRLLEHLWNFNDPPGEETVRAHIKLLRRQLKASGVEEEVIETVYGLGYRLKFREEKASLEFLPTNSQPNSLLQEATTEVWEQVKVPFLERLNTIEQAILSFQAGSGSETLRSQAEQVAHKLAGSLGMFGYDEGSRLGRSIEQGLQFLNLTQLLSQLQAWVEQLREELHKEPAVVTHAPTIGPSEKASLTENLILLSPVQTPPVKDETPLLIREARVLIVDDDPLILHRLQEILPKWGLEPLLLQNPLQFWQALTANSPDLVILDVDMPECNGIDLCKAIRQDSNWEAIPILFLSARRDPATIHHIYAAGADDYIAKPFTEPELMTRILNRLERNRLIQLWSLQNARKSERDNLL